MALVPGCPEMFTTDQGVQCTRLAFPRRLAPVGGASRMDGRGRARENLFVERWWRPVQDADIDLQAEATVPALEAGLESSVTCDHDEWPHPRLAYRTPAEVHGAMSGCAAPKTP
jgi:putative transposase